MQPTNDELFDGKLPVAQAIKKLRTRLLDLSARNRLVSYKHPKGRCLQFVNKPNLNLVFDRLVEGKSILLSNVPDPAPDLFTKKRLDVKTHAQTLDIDTSEEFTALSCSSPTNKHTPKIQTLYYPVDLERICRKLRTEARTVIEETGTNMLYLIFGFLEYYESEDSERSMLAPLLSIPVALEKDAIDEESRTYRYVLNYSGEDIHDNASLREKLSREFAFQLPHFDEEDEPGHYFSKVQNAVRSHKRWTVRYQLTLGFLSFGKLAIWADLDPRNWPDLAQKPLLTALFSGGSGNDASYDGEDYDIDKHPDAAQPSLIYDADSAQHSAIIDVLAGKNLVINGPPGTGKSQTITNIIAAALLKGQRVLFVSEKLAALEVVRHRLNQANLGHFCLELHSHKTQKKRLLEDLQTRLDEKFPPQQHIGEKMTVLNQQREELNAYATIMASQVGNELNLTVHEVFWRTDYFRRLSGDFTLDTTTYLPQAAGWSLATIEQKRAKLDVLGRLYEATGGYMTTNTWWGFTPTALIPGDEEAIRLIMSVAAEKAQKLLEVVEQYWAKTGLSDEPSMEHLASLHDVLLELPAPPLNLLNEMMPYLYRPEAQAELLTYKLVRRAINDITEAIRLNATTKHLLCQPCPISYDQAKILLDSCSNQLTPNVNSMPLAELSELVQAALNAHELFAVSISAASFAYLPVLPIAFTRLQTLLQEVQLAGPVTLLGQPIQKIREGATLLAAERNRLQSAYQRIEQIANRHQIELNGTPASVSLLSRSHGIDGLVAHVQVDTAVLERGKELLRLIPKDCIFITLQEVQAHQYILSTNQKRIDELLDLLSGFAQQVSFPFDGTSQSVTGLLAISEIAAAAPKNLLDYRWSPLSAPHVTDLLQEAIILQAEEKAQRESLATIIHLDTLPNQEMLKAALRFFRQAGDSLFNLFNEEWRSAKKMLGSISKEKLRGKSADFQDILTRIITWEDQRSSFTSNLVFQENFGPLYRGVETDFTKVQRLHDWYITSQSKLRSQPGQAGLIELTSVDREVLFRYDALSTNIFNTVMELNQCQQDIDRLVGNLAGTLPRKSWPQYSAQTKKIEQHIDELIGLVRPYVTPEISISRAISLLSAKTEFAAASEDFDTLRNGLSIIQNETTTYLPGLAEINCSSWPSYLDQLTRIGQAVNRLIDAHNPYNEIEATPGQMQSFFAAKLRLQDALATFTVQLKATDAHDWMTYSSVVKQQIDAIHQLVTALLRAISDPTSCLRDTFDGLWAAKQSVILIQQVEEDLTDASLPDGIFNGLATDLAALETTLAWGDEVMANDVFATTELRPLLTNSQSTTNYWWAKETTETVLKLELSLKETLNDLSQFGTFSWPDWTQITDGRPWYASQQLRHINSALSHAGSVMVWSQYNTARIDCAKDKLTPFVALVERLTIPARQIGSVFQYAVYWSIGRKMYTDFPILQTFVGTKHESLRAEFSLLDREIIGLTGKAFAHHINRNERPPAGINASSPRDKTNMWLLRHELGKQKRHIPIRQLVKRAGAALQALKPCFMMGPLSVAQYLEPGTVHFDLIVMDEASQLRPEDALGAIARGKQLVVVGDPKQLPPTNFFDRIMDSDDDEEQEAADVFTGSESILDICQQLFHPVRTLRWHYRSQHESLIAFSNHHFYDGKLIIFPSPFDRNSRLGVRYRYVKNGIYQDRQNLVEASRVADAVLEHILKYPHESLGVVTLNQTQRDLLDDLLDKKLQDNAAVANYKDHWENEGFPFFVKNLENVQGDERDVIFISTTFGKSPNSNKVRQNFGPISRADGWRRLNVLFTRARRKVDVFSSMQPEDIYVDEKTLRGTKALRDYLEYVKNGILTTFNPTGREADSDFELSVKDLLQSKGYEVIAQLGVAGFFIDLAVRNPDRPGEFLAAVECDGATYHSSKSARDRDRIRQSILESLGWKDRIWRIWSTDWFYNPRRASDQLINFLDARRAASRLDTQHQNFEEEVIDEDIIISDSTNLGFATTTNDAVSIRSRGDRYVEIGDKVTYCFMDKQLEVRTVSLVEGANDPMRNQFNDQSPLGKALLDAKIGEVRVLEYNGKSRSIRLIAFAKNE